MKTKILALVISALLVVALAACGGGGGSGGGAASTPIQDFLDAEGADAQAELDALAPMLGLGDGARVVLSANDANNELIFSFYFGEFDGLSDEELEMVAEMISDMMGPMLQPMAAEMRDEIGIDALTLTIVILSLQGDVISTTSIDT